jgi:hypothetical protein
MFPRQPLSATDDGQSSIAVKQQLTHSRFEGTGWGMCCVKRPPRSIDHVRSMDGVTARDLDWAYGSYDLTPLSYGSASNHQATLCPGLDPPAFPVIQDHRRTISQLLINPKAKLDNVTLGWHKNQIRSSYDKQLTLVPN